jgi:hypothetical protein
MELASSHVQTWLSVSVCKTAPWNEFVASSAPCSRLLFLPTSFKKKNNTIFAVSRLVASCKSSSTKLKQSCLLLERWGDSLLKSGTVSSDRWGSAKDPVAKGGYFIAQYRDSTEYHLREWVRLYVFLNKRICLPKNKQQKIEDRNIHLSLSGDNSILNSISFFV